MSRVDRAFRRFQRTGDPDALAFVFDRVAPELARLAVHLAPQAAEDLVQDTFLFAIERAASFEPSGRVLPWLVGVLAHKARAARRLSRRTPDVGRLPPPGVHDPEGEAEESEVNAELREAIDALPEPYRGVLGPQLREGLAPDEIAQRLGRNPSTVRTQLSRGLERLRARLPRGLGAVAVVVPPGLARVREVVLRAVPARPIVRTASSFGVLSVAAALLVVGGVAWAWGGGATSVASVEIAPMAEVEGPRVEVATDVAGERVATTEVAGAASPPVLVPLAVRVAVIGRCVDDGDGSPLAGMTVVARDISASRVHLQVRYGLVPTVAPAPVLTESDGTFRLHVEAGLGSTWYFSCSGPGYAATDVEVMGRELCDHGDDGLDLGDQRMVRGVPVTGRVVDERGAPVEGVAGSVQIAERGPRGQSTNVSFRSGADGRWICSSLVPIGRYPFAVWQRVGTARIDQMLHTVRTPEFLIAEGAEARLDLVASAAPQVHGRVVDVEGEPAAGVLVAAVSDVGIAGRRRVAQSTSNADGRFIFVSQVLTGGELHVIVDPKSGFELVGDPVATTSGARDVLVRVRRVVVPACGVVNLTVVDAGSGEPIELYRLSFRRDYEGRFSSESGPSRAKHPEGRLRIDNQPPGRVTLDILLPLGYPRTLAEVTVPEAGTIEHRVAVMREALCVLHVRVLGPDGLPLAGAEVEAVAPGPGAAMRSEDPVLPALGYGYGPRHQQIDSARSSRQGRCRLFAPQRAAPYVVRVRAPGLPGTLHDGVVCDAAEREVVVAVTTAAVLTARLTPASVAAMPLTLRLLEGGRPVALAHLGDSGNGFAFTRDGTLRVDGVPPGLYDAQLVFESAPLGIFKVPSVLRELGPVSLHAAQPCDLVIDASAFTPATLVGRIAPGTPWLPHEVFTLSNFVPGARAGTLTVGPVPVRADGTFTLPNVPPGRFRLRVNIGGATHTSVEEVELPAGATVEQTFTLRREG